MFSGGARVAFSEWKIHFNLPKMIWNILLLYSGSASCFFLSLNANAKIKSYFFSVLIITHFPLAKPNSDWRKNYKEIERQRRRRPKKIPNTIEKTYRNSSCLILIKTKKTIWPVSAMGRWVEWEKIPFENWKAKAFYRSTYFVVRRRYEWISLLCLGHLTV